MLERGCKILCVIAVERLGPFEELGLRLNMSLEQRTSLVHERTLRDMLDLWDYAVQPIE